MKLGDILQQIPLQPVTTIDTDREVAGGYASDLLSDVMGRAAPDSIWVTNQAHQNVAAVAIITEVAAVVVAAGIRPDADLVKKANANGVNLLVTELPLFAVVGQLYELGIPGKVKQ